MLVDEFDSSTVTVKKDELLVAIKKNLETHKATFEEAFASYKKAYLEEVGRMLDEAKRGGVLRHAVALVVPVNHEGDYTRIIRMLSMSTATEVKISEHQFQQYVMDDWGWKKEFVATTSRYTGK